MNNENINVLEEQIYTCIKKKENYIIMQQV